MVVSWSLVIVRAQVPEAQWRTGAYCWQGFSSPRVPGDKPGSSLITNMLMALTVAPELDEEEPPVGRYTSGRDETLASELDAVMLVVETRP